MITSPSFHYPLVGSGTPAQGRFFSLTARAIPPATDQPQALLIVRVNDVSERLREEERQQREKAQLRSRAQLRQIVARETDERLRTS